MDSERVEWQHAQPSPELAPYVERLVGYRYEGLPPGEHRGLPSCQITVVISLGGPTRMAAMPDPTQRPGRFAALAGGLHLRPAVIAHDGSEHGIQLDLTPAGSRALLGVPAGALGPLVVDLSDVIGRDADEVIDRCLDSHAWTERFSIVECVLTRRVADRAPARAPLAHAWARITRSVGTAGTARIAAVAAEIGWSRRHLAERFREEFGVTPSEAGRLARFQRSHRLLKRPGHRTLADVAAASGYYDQAHMAHEWNDLAGCPPSEWLATESLPFVQDPLAHPEPD